MQSELLRVVIDMVTQLSGNETPGETIAKVLVRIGLAAGLKRVWLIELGNDGGKSLTVPYQWTAGAVAQLETSQILLAHPAIEMWLRALSRCEHVVATAGTAMPAVSEILDELELQALLLMPIFDGHRLSGYLGFGLANAFDAWTEPELDTLRIVAQLIGAAVRSLSPREPNATKERRLWLRPFVARERTRSEKRNPARAELERARP